MSLESSEKQKSGSVPLTASQQAAAAKTASSADKARQVVAKTTAPQKQPKSTDTKGADSKASEAKSSDTKGAESKTAKAPAAQSKASPSKGAEAKGAEAKATPSEAAPVEDKAAAKARAKQEKAEAKERAKAEKAERKKAAQAERRRVSSGGIKDLFVLHVEKFALGICALLALGLIYMSLGKLSLDPHKTPNDLRTQLDGIEQKVANMPFNMVEKEFVVPPYDANISRFKVQIRPQLMALNVPWDPLIVPPHKRGTPEMLPPLQPIATAGNGVYLVKVRQQRPAAANPPPRAAGPAGTGPAAGAAAGAAGRPVAAAPAPRGGAGLNVGDDGPVVVPDGAPKPVPEEILRELGGIMPVLDEKLRVYPEGRRWVVVVGLIPLSAQMAEYARHFANAFEHSPDDDEPKYAEVRVMRVEVTPGIAESEIDWSKATVLEWPAQLAQYKADQAPWYMTAPEVVPQKYVRNDSGRLPEDWRKMGLGVITKPLGPLLAQPWKDVTHPKFYQAPAIEAPPAEAPKQAEPAPAPVVEAPKVEVDPNDPFHVKPAVAPAPKPEVRRAAPVAPKERPVESDQVEYQLVRVFDFTVQPGKQYRYKLQLMVQNPNFMVDAKNLEDPSVAKTRRLDTPWSEASNTVAIPFGQSVLADTVVRPAPQAAGPNAAPAGPAAAPESTEPLAHVVVKILNFDAGQETFAKLELKRGFRVAGTATQFVLDPLRRLVAQQNNVEIHTDLVVADFQGGEKLEEGLEAPTEMLFIDAAGQLVVQNSVQDELWVKAFHYFQKLMTENVTPPDEVGQAKQAVDPLDNARKTPPKAGTKPAKAPR